MTDEWHQTACILCSINCGIEVKLGSDPGEERRFVRIRGDKAHPQSKGYTCQKALRLDHYQNARDRLTSPMRRRPDGTFEAVDWDTAITEVAARLAEVRDTYGGKTIFYYGGGGQGNHLVGAYGMATRAALGVRYASNALAQEKTGEFWVDGQLFGKARCHTTGDYEHSQVAVFWGKNPWQSHGFPRARTVLKEIANDPERTLVVVDPRRTESAELADVHLQVRPGGDAHALAALLATLIEEDLVDHAFLESRTAELDAVLEVLAAVDIAEYSRRAGVTEQEIRDLARLLGRAESVAIFEDLGIQQAPHSTLNSYLEKLAFLLTGNFGNRGGMNLHSRFASLGGGGIAGGIAAEGPPIGTVGDAAPDPSARPLPRASETPVTGHRLVTGLVPCNVIPDEILTDHPDRFRAMIVEATNPVHSLADSPRMREALDALEFVLVVDVAMTETAQHADYVLPAASQYEKWEATFFNLEFPVNTFHLRRPLLEPLPGTLPECEIHARLVRALDAYQDDDLVPLREAAEQGSAAYTDAFLTTMLTRPDLARLAPVLLYETIGASLPEGAEGAAAVAGLAQLCFLSQAESVRRAGFESGDELFDAILASPSGVVFTVDDYEETWARILHPDGRIHLAIPDLLAELAGLADEDPSVADPEWPFVLTAGERRSFTANTIYRDPAWRKQDAEGSLRIHPDDAVRVGVADGGHARITTRRGSAIARVETSDALLPGHISLPNGLGLGYPDDSGTSVLTGVAPNELTSSDDRDWFAGTPHHKHVKARVEPAPAAEAVPA
jgi:anaerobic selenocysteine-containing dehydrogenase